jgi:hypothetical protein
VDSSSDDQRVRQLEVTMAELDEVLRQHEQKYSPAVLAADAHLDIPSEPRRVVPWR